MVFRDVNGEPRLIKHNCSPERKGYPITEIELHRFGIELLTELYSKEGMAIKDINGIEGYEYPQFVMESPNNKLYYIAVKATVYPTDPFSLPKKDCFQIISLARKFNATPAFAGIGFASVDGVAFDKGIRGGSFFVSFKGLELLT